MESEDAERIKRLFKIKAMRDREVTGIVGVVF